MIIFKCDFCFRQFDAKTSMQGIRYTYANPDTGATENVVADRDTDPCIECNRKAQQAATDTLNSIKAVHEPAHLNGPTTANNQ